MAMGVPQLSESVPVCVPAMLRPQARSRAHPCCPAQGVTTARVRVMPMGHVTRVPREFASACAAWGPWEARAFDVPALAARVKALLSNVLPPGLRPPEDPAQVSAAQGARRALCVAYWRAETQPAKRAARALMAAGVPHPPGAWPPG